MQVQSFNDLPLSDDVLRGIKDLGFEKPSPIQAQSIMPLLQGRDVIGQAQTGTGKTAAFGIPMVESIDLLDRRVQGLVLAPTRELAVQIADHISRISRYTGIRVCPIYGGEKINKQIRQLKSGVHIVVGTPGRIIDHLERGTLKLKDVHTVVLDEADRMLDMGFIKDINKILDRVPKHKQTSLFSATMDRNIWKICDKYMDRPEKILVSEDEIALEQIHQRYVKVDTSSRYPILEELIADQGIRKAIIFTRTKRGAHQLARKLKNSGYNADSLHGNLSQPQRDRVTRGFRKHNVDFLVATDIAARGLDITGITHIINYNIPRETLSYFHRIGRTARMEAEGTAITFVAHGEEKAMADIKAQTSTRITELKTSVNVKAGPAEKHRAICRKCKIEFDLPFKPTDGRPVYCLPCLKTRKRHYRRRH
ncbi:DEAD/DEAH box helicase [Candidatus Bathyarchaeota archaeon]|nr:DEAD/DEAH box helicase [Candidatus Bathyarchaeota archaeon]MBL7080272.1 DEAD/DEAH box helicase [Candidatus Bathyarchaeota archaeon]